MQQAAKPDRVPVLAAIFRWIDRPLAFLGAGLLSALETAAAMMTPVLLQGLIRSVSGDEAGLAGSLLLAAVLLGFTPLIGLGGRRIKRIAREGVGALRQGIFHHILSLPYGAFHSGSLGAYTALLTADTERATAFLQGYTVGSLFRAGILLAVSWVVLARQSLAMLSLGLMLAALSWALPACLHPLEQRLRLSIQAQLDESGRQISQAVQGAAEIRSFGLQPQLAGQYSGICRKIRRSRIRLKLLDAAINGWIELARMSAQPLALASGAFAVARGAMSLDVLALVSGYAGLLAEAAGSLSLFTHHSQLSLASAKRILSLLKTPVEQGGCPNGYDGGAAAEDAICFNQVSFGYPGRAPLLDNACLQIPKGQICALVGASGSGKSTLFKLLLGFYSPTQGEIRMMGRPVGAMTLEQLRAMTAYVSQDATLFQASILDNIRWGRPGADMRQVEEAARRAKIHDFIGTLPEGYATILSDGAQNISGGQRQRIALARAILKDAPILLLDEFTSALDEDTERTMIDDLRPVFQGKTVLMIAHRPAALAVADRIVSLEKGRLSPVSPKRR